MTVREKRNSDEVLVLWDKALKTQVRGFEGFCLLTFSLLLAVTGISRSKDGKRG